MNSLTFQTLPSDARVLTVDETDVVAGGALPAALLIAGARFAIKKFAGSFFTAAGAGAAGAMYYKTGVFKRR